MHFYHGFEAIFVQLLSLDRIQFKLQKQGLAEYDVLTVHK